MQSMTLDQEKIAVKAVFGQLMKSEYGVWIDNIINVTFPEF